MKSFYSLREQTVLKKSIGRVPVEIKKQGSKFVVFVDGDRLDHYKSQQEAERMAAEFIKQYKG